MPESDSPQIRRDRITALIATAIVCLAFPTIVVLVYDVFAPAAERRLVLYWLAGGVAVGLLIPILFWAPYRALGFATYAATALLAAAIIGVWTGTWSGWLHGLALGAIIGALVRGRRGPEFGEENSILVGAVLLGAGIAWGIVVSERPFNRAGYYTLVLSAILFLWTWTRLFRPAFELFCEPITWLMYSIRARGPGLASFPRTGPCIVIANHACWLDPLFLAKILPRPITPMMTSKFYDLPVLHRLMIAFGVIRVPEKAIKKETPEIQAAIAALDRGECVVIFPEGYLRRTENQPLRRFGQGIWHLLQARPNTPVFTCWIEGNWGSYTSYFNGKPTKNKRCDFRRRITISVSDTVTIPAEVLVDHLRTRIHIMNLVAAARAHIDLPPLPNFELAGREDDKSEEVEEPTTGNGGG
jgi:1-acyl-sn-glycerol-3-phosphate acyltransferase